MLGIISFAPSSAVPAPDDDDDDDDDDNDDKDDDVGCFLTHRSRLPFITDRSLCSDDDDDEDEEEDDGDAVLFPTGPVAPTPPPAVDLPIQ